MHKALSRPNLELPNVDAVLSIGTTIFRGSNPYPHGALEPPTYGMEMDKMDVLVVLNKMHYCPVFLSTVRISARCYIVLRDQYAQLASNQVCRSPPVHS